MSSFRIELKLIEDEESFRAMILHNEEITQIFIPKSEYVSVKTGRHNHELDELFRVIRQTLGAKLFPHHTIRYRETAHTNGIRYTLDGFVDDPVTNEELCPTQQTPEK